MMPNMNYTVDGVEYTAIVGWKNMLPVYWRDGSFEKIKGNNFTFTSIPNGNFAYVEEKDCWYILDRNTGVWLYKSTAMHKKLYQRLVSLMEDKEFMRVFDSPETLEAYQAKLVKDPIRKDN